ncbi:hypothetical protein BDV59DRAFT_66208 [Aspergillus ambiguus]|uniref:uncharacterized protein n=1 Tax=Aspergillus ambiguus TaxID=176160 RepID=UPI003CCDA659
MPVSFLPCQEGAEEEAPLPYTDAPLKLLIADIRLFVKCLPSLPGVFLPLTPCLSGSLDEMYPSPANIGIFLVHLVLCVLQLAFLISLPLCVLFMLPALGVLIYAAVFLTINAAVCHVVFNRHDAILRSVVPHTERPEHHREHWIFLNGVAVGRRWLQNSIDRLAYSFGRRVTGVHNRTYGMVFDIIECLVQRNFCYATQDIRDTYALAKKTLLDPKYDKVVLICHSQGGIEGGLVVDWLIDELSCDILSKLEVYTFGSAANHFNNPYKSLVQCPDGSSNGEEPSRPKYIRHIEHYANSGDLVSRWGIINFARVPNRYVGQVFIRPGKGHQMNQHYLDMMFPIGPDKEMPDTNEFMEMPVELPASRGCGRDYWDDSNHSTLFRPDGQERILGEPVPDSYHNPKTVKVKDVSRLWLYRNGRSPVG